MSKIFFLFILTLLNLCIVAQSKQAKKEIATMGFAGKYDYGSSAEKEEVGLAYIYAESDSTILFYLDLNSGPPSLSMGAICGRAIVKNKVGLFETVIQGSKDSCKFILSFQNNQLIIKTKDSQYNCGFGHGVYADGTYKRFSSKNPTYYLSQEAEKIYFKELQL